MKSSRPVWFVAAFLAACFAGSLESSAATPATASAPFSPEQVDFPPYFRHRVPPAVPVEAGSAIAAKEATISIVVDAEGCVTAATVKSASEPAFGEASLAAVKQWTFFPALKNKRPVACRSEELVRWPFPSGDRAAPVGSVGPRMLPPGTVEFDRLDRKPVLRSSVQPEIPQQARRFGTPGRVILEFVVDADGIVRDPRVVKTTSGTMNQPAMDAALQFRFQPGEKDHRRVPSVITMPIDFEPAGTASERQGELRLFSSAKVGDDTADVRARQRDQEEAYAPRPADGIYPVSRVDRIPSVKSMFVDQDLPRTPPPKGFATLEFVVDREGMVTDIVVRDASDSEVADYARRTESNRWYRPAQRGGRPVACRMQMTYDFSAVRPPSTPSTES